MNKKTDIEPEQKGSDSDRRNLIKSLAAGGTIAVALPKRWTTPIVDAVVLPAHAQTSDSCAAPGTGSSNTPGLTANVTFAVIDGGGDLIVVGESDVPDVCFVGVGGGPGDRGLTCEVLDCNGTLLASEDTDTFGDIGSGGCSAAGEVCMVSCSVEVTSGSHSVVAGDAVTLRFSFLGGCMVSAVETVS